MRTRRSLARSGARRISFAGFPVVGARADGIHRHHAEPEPLGWSGGGAGCTGSIRASCRAIASRPATSLAFEFVEQPFLLDCRRIVSGQIRGEARTILEVGSQQVRSETAIDMTWLGELFDVELGVGAGLEVVSVGPRIGRSVAHGRGSLWRGKTVGREARTPAAHPAEFASSA